MDYMKKILSEVNVQDNTLYDYVYELISLAKLKESLDNTKNGKVMSLQDLRRYIDVLEARHESNNIR